MKYIFGEGSFRESALNPLLRLSATALARLIRSREITSVAVLQAHMDHIHRVNPTLNALVVTRFPEALTEAEEADRKIRKGDPETWPPFLGVPCTIKEASGLSGMPHTAGLVSRKGVLCPRDGTPVARLRAAGFIPLGVTNVSEMCMWMESNNHVYGLTNNAYDPKRTAGGSSGGEGSIVGAGGSPVGLGTDFGGSIRLPAFFNGVFGHKPTGGLVPSTGQFPTASDGAKRFLATGPLARKAEDLMPFLQLIAGPDGQDPSCQPMDLGDPTTVRWEDLKVLHVANNGLARIDPELRAAQRQCLYHLASRGARIEEAVLPKLKRSVEIWAAMMSANNEISFGELLGEGHRIEAVPSLARWALRRSPHTLPALALVAVEKVVAQLPKKRAEMVALCKDLRDELVGLLGLNGVMLFPPYPTTAPLHSRPLLLPIHWVYPGIFNVLEMPATQVPLGLDGAGLPLGVQVIGTHGRDHLTIAVAMELERAFGGWVPPSRWT